MKNEDTGPGQDLSSGAKETNPTYQSQIMALDTLTSAYFLLGEVSEKLTGPSVTSSITLPQEIKYMLLKNQYHLSKSCLTLSRRLALESLTRLWAQEVSSVRQELAKFLSQE